MRDLYRVISHDVYMNDSISLEAPAAVSFDRVAYFCGSCHEPGFISAVWVSVTKIILQGSCHHCCKISLRSFDLLTIDDWLRDQREAPE